MGLVYNRLTCKGPFHTKILFSLTNSTWFSISKNLGKISKIIILPYKKMIKITKIVKWVRAKNRLLTIFTSSSINLILTVIIRKDQTERENLDSGVLKKSSYSHILFIIWLYNSNKKIFAHGQIFLDPQLHEVEKIIIFHFFCNH